MNTQKQNIQNVILSHFPQTNFNTSITQQQLSEILNKLIQKIHPASYMQQQYDPDTLDELYERMNSLYQCNLSSFLQVHIEAANLLENKINSTSVKIQSINDFVQNVQNKSSQIKQKSNQQRNQFKLNNIKVNDIQSNFTEVRFTYSNIIDTTFPVIRNVAEINQQFNIHLEDFFTIALFDNHQILGEIQITFDCFDLERMQQKSFTISNDQNENYIISVLGKVEIQNSQDALNDLNSVKDNLENLYQENLSYQEQLKGLEMPFQAVSVEQGLFRAPSHNTSFNEPSQQQFMFVKNQQHSYNSGIPSQNNNISVQKINSNQPQTNVEHTDNELNNFGRKIYILFIVYLFISMLLCIKKSCLLDVTISILFLGLLYRRQISLIEKKYVLYFILVIFWSVVIDIVWMVLYFPQWTKDASSDDQGSQKAVRVSVLVISVILLLFKGIVMFGLYHINQNPSQRNEAEVAFLGFIQDAKRKEEFNILQK